MVQLHILSGKKAGVQWTARRFPFWVGRAGSSDLVIEDAGVWDRHVEIARKDGEGFYLTTSTDATAYVNGSRATSELLKSGDLIEIGGAKIRFSLAPAAQKGLWIREAAIWAGLVAVCVLQALLISWLT